MGLPSTLMRILFFLAVIRAVQGVTLLIVSDGSHIVNTTINVEYQRTGGEDNDNKKSFVIRLTRPFRGEEEVPGDSITIPPMENEDESALRVATVSLKLPLTAGKYEVKAFELELPANKIGKVLARTVQFDVSARPTESETTSPIPTTSESATTEDTETIGSTLSPPPPGHTNSTHTFPNPPATLSSALSSSPVSTQESISPPPTESSINTSEPASTSGAVRKPSTGKIVGSVLGVFIAIIALIAGFIIWRKRRQNTLVSKTEAGAFKRELMVRSPSTNMLELPNPSVNLLDPQTRQFSPTPHGANLPFSPEPSRFQ